MEQRKIFHDSVVPIPEGSGPIHNGLMIRAAEPEHKNEELKLLFSVETSKESKAALEELVAKGQSTSIEELNKKYAVQPADTNALRKWLKANKFKIIKVSDDGASIYATARIDQIEKMLQVKMIRVTKNGVTYTAAQNAPSLPVSVGKNVHAIIGLQPFRQAHKNSRKFIQTGNNMAISTPMNSSRSAAINTKPPYLVKDILRAYNADKVAFTGKGQTIAILIDTFPNDADLKLFWKKNNLRIKLSQVKKINATGETLPPPEGEETLDVEWSGGIAPGATIRIYATGSLRFVDLDQALDRIIEDLPRQKSMRQLSISLGLGETFMGGPDGEVATQHAKFLKLAAAGVNVFISSGDAGSNPGESGQNPNGPLQAEYGSSDSSVIGVGGTTLKFNSSGSIKTETGWPGSGGGKSKFFSKPSWQNGTGITGNKRLVPDVSAVADPNTGGLVVLNGRAMQYGGTSWSAPIWAGFCALINEARKKAKKPLLPFLNPLIYPLMGSKSFRDIQKGDNGAYNAGNGHDLITGIGVPDVEELIKALA